MLRRVRSAPAVAVRARLFFVLSATLAVGTTAILGCDKPPKAAETASSATAAEPPRPCEGATPMTREKLLEQLRALDQAKVDALGPSLATTARAAPRSAVELYLGADEDAADKAQRLLIGLDDLAIVPLVEAANPPSAQQRLWMVARSVAAELALRQKVIGKLDKLLDDKSPLPVQTRGPTEQKPPERRVCDQAYLLMRQIVHFGESPEDASVQAQLFLNAPPDFRDEQIRKARASATWNRAITGKDVEDYPAPKPRGPKGE
jgi:hypothetical protein